MIRPPEARLEARRPLTVSELAHEIELALGPLNPVLVKGEVFGVRRSGRGHYTFTVKDARAVIQAVLFASDARRLGIVPEDGQEFIFRGKIDFWPQAGQLRLVVDFIQFDDLGRMRAQLEALKHRLELEGAFAAERKRPLPFLPRVVALITSPTGAVIHDLQETILDRYPNMEILVYPAQVQGLASAASVAAALRRCNQEGRAEVAVIARGGGSFEELYAFNTEQVARAILSSRLPVVTALGHTSDRTLADMVADVECRTPTEAAIRVVPRKADLEAQLQDRRRRLDKEAQRRLVAAAEQLEHRRQRLEALVPALVRVRAARLERCRAELERLSPSRQLQLRRDHLAGLEARLEAAARRLVRTRQMEIEARRGPQRLARALAGRLQAAESALAQRRQRLEALSPQRVLARGYSITTDEAGRVLRSSVETSPGRRVRVRLAAGRLGALVEEVAG